MKLSVIFCAILTSTVSALPNNKLNGSSNDDLISPDSVKETPHPSAPERFDSIDLTDWNLETFNKTIHDPDFDFSRDGLRILHLASENGATDIVSQLIWMLKDPKINNVYGDLFQEESGPTETEEAKNNRDLEKFKLVSSLAVSYRLAAENKHEMICQMIYQLGMLPSKDVIVITAKNGLTSMVKSILLPEQQQKSPRSPISKLFFGNDKVDHPEFDEAIVVAAKNGHDEILQLLLIDARGDPFTRRNEALIGAAAEGHSKCVEMLLASDNKSQNIKTDDIHRAFFIAAANNHIKVVKSLYESKANGIKGRDCFIIGKTLEQVAITGNTDIIKLLRQDPCLTTAKNDETNFYWSAVMKCCKYGNGEALDALVPEISSIKKEVWSKLFMTAVESGHENIVEMLIQNGTIQAFGTENEALRVANPSMKKILLKHYNPLTPPNETETGVEEKVKVTDETDLQMDQTTIERAINDENLSDEKPIDETSMKEEDDEKYDEKDADKIDDRGKEEDEFEH